MENKDYTIVCQVFVCKTKYLIHGYLCGGSRRGQQWGVWRQKGLKSWRELNSNEENKFPTSRILQSGRKILNTIKNNVNHVKCT